MNTPSTPVSDYSSAVTPLLLSFQLPALGVQTELPFAIKISDFRSGVFSILSDLIEGFCDGLVERGLLCASPRGEDGRQAQRQQLDRFADDVSKRSLALSQSSFMASCHVDEGRCEVLRQRRQKFNSQESSSGRQNLDFKHIDPVEVLRQYAIPLMSDDDSDFGNSSLGGALTMDSPRRPQGVAEAHHPIGKRVPRALPAKYVSLEGKACDKSAATNLGLAAGDKARVLFRANREPAEKRLSCADHIDERPSEERVSEDRPSQLRLELPAGEGQVEAHRRNEFRIDRSDRSPERSPRRKDVSLPEETCALRVQKPAQAAGLPAGASVSLQAAHRSVRLSRTVLDQKPDVVLPLVYVSREPAKASSLAVGVAATASGAVKGGDAELAANSASIVGAASAVLEPAKQHKPSAEGEASSPRRGKQRNVSPLRDLGLNSFTSELVGRTFAEFQKSSPVSLARANKANAQNSSRTELPAPPDELPIKELLPDADVPTTRPNEQNFKPWNASSKDPPSKGRDSDPFVVTECGGGAAGKDFLPILASTAPPAARQHKAARFRSFPCTKSRKQQQELPALMMASGLTKHLKAAASCSNPPGATT